MWIQKRQRDNRLSDVIDMNFTVRQLQEKCQEQNVDIYMTFVEVTKAFDIVVMDSRISWSRFAVHPDSKQWCGNFIMA